MKKYLNYMLTVLLTMLAGQTFAQQPEMADAFRADGKIYVVVAIVLIVLTGLIAYLFLIDRKLDRLEQQMDKENQTK